MTSRCRVVMVDGEPVRVQYHGDGWDDADSEAFAEIVRAARAKFEEEHPDGRGNFEEGHADA